MPTKRLKIFGIVQGVGFRYSMLHAAHEIGVHGWVKNCSDGSVEAVIQGHQKQIDQMITWTQKGPSMSNVERVDITEATGTFHEFQIV